CRCGDFLRSCRPRNCYFRNAHRAMCWLRGPDRRKSPQRQEYVNLSPSVVRRFTTPPDGPPRTQLLSNGRYGVMLTTAGSGYSRWREDFTRDCWGAYIFLRDEQ